MREIKFKAWDKEFKRFSEIGLETQAKVIEYATDYRELGGHYIELYKRW